MTQRGPALVRIALFCLFFGAFAMGLVQPAQAGTEEAPEIQDPAGDSIFPAGHDIVAVWIEQTPVDVPDAGPALHLRVRVAEDFQHAPALFASATRYRISFSSDDVTMLPAGAVEAYVNLSPSCVSSSVVVTAAPNCTEESVSCRFGTTAATGGSAPLAEELALTSSFDEATLFGCLLPLSMLGTFGEGDSLTSLVLAAQLVSRGPLSGAPPTGGDNVPVTVVETWDRAPDEGVGQDFFFGTATGNTTDPNDSDSDGLNDTWETDNFGNATNANATGDPDGDGLTNGQEEALGTDPNKADTDADGCNDKEDSAPLDPAAGCGQGENTTSSTTSTSTSSSSTTTSSTSGTTTSSTSTSSGAQGNGGVDSFDEAVDRLTSDAGYLGMSAGGFLAVLVLAILALAVRWSL